MPYKDLNENKRRSIDKIDALITINETMIQVILEEDGIGWTDQGQSILNLLLQQLNELKRTERREVA